MGSYGYKLTKIFDDVIIMLNFKRSKTKTSKAKTSKTKTPEYLLDESFHFVFPRQSISVASVECLKSVKI